MSQLEDFLVDMGPTHLPVEQVPELKTDLMRYYDYLSRVSERVSLCVQDTQGHALRTCSPAEAGGAAGVQVRSAWPCDSSMKLNEVRPGPRDEE